MHFTTRWRALAWAALFGFFTSAWAFAAAPTITGFKFPGSPTTASYYSFSVGFSALVTVSGTPAPSITVRVGGVDRQATIVSLSGYNLIADYTPQPGDNGPLSVPGPIVLNGASIKGSDGTDADLTFAPVENSGITIDTTPPAAPVVSGVAPSSPTYQQFFTFTGTAEPGSTIYFRGNTRYQAPTGMAGANGNWSVTFSPQPAGTYNFNVTARDHAGNESPATAASVTVTYLPGNGTSPKIVSIQPPGDGLYGGYYNTRHDTLHVFVGFDQPVLVSGNLTLTVHIGSVTTELVSAWVDGNAVAFNLNLPSLVFDGSLDITGPINLNGGSITATDGTPATLTFTPVAATGVYIDTTPPPAPVMTGVTPSAPTADQAFTLAGTAEAGDTVQITALGTYTNVPVDASGHWSATFGPLAAGSYTFGLSAKDKAGNWSYLPDATGGAPTNVTVTVQPAGTKPPPPPPSGPAAQTITFASPVSAVMIGQPVTLGATSSAGLPISYSVIAGNATISGNVLTPQSTALLVVRASAAGNDSYAAASSDVNFGNPQKTAQAITADTSTQDVKAGSTLTLNATSTSGLPVSYAVVSGPATVSGNMLTVTGASGTVTVRASQPGNDTVAAADAVTLTFEIVPVPVSRLVNLSSRLHVSANDAAGASIAGFVITGSSPQPFLIRAVGPTLGQFGVSRPLAAPELRLFGTGNAQIASNAGWSDDPQIAAAAQTVGAFPLASGSKDAALLVTLAPGSYTAQVASSGSGTALIEVYDVAAASLPTKQLINISARGTVGAGDDVLISGFVITGNQPKRVLIRGVGPGLGKFLAGFLPDPVLTVYDTNRAVVAWNDNWGTPQPVTPSQVLGTPADIAAASAATGAFPLAEGSGDAAVLLTLPPGQYSAVVTGTNGSSGAALVEVYEVPE